MAFKKISHVNRKVQMVSLIDLIFILLIFFIITSIMIKLSKGEAKLYVPTPKNEPGEAQIFIQIIDEDKYLWIDHTVIDTLNAYSYKMPDPVSTQYKVNVLLEKMVVSETGLQQKIERLKRQLQRQPNEDYFILIRCPEDKPYYVATNIIEQLVDTPQLEYGCVAGSVDDLKTGNILAQGNVFQIDF